MMKYRQRIGLLMGSFNPIQNAHICMAQHVLNYGLVDCVVFIPTLQNVWKDKTETAPFEDRMHMVELAINSADYLKNCLVSNIELTCHQDPDNAFSYETINALMERDKSDNITYYLMGGSDVMETIDKWRHSEDILLRPNLKLIEFGRNETKCPARQDTIFIPSLGVNISSTMVREMARKNENIYPLVPKQVESYIKDKHLYTK